YTYLIGNKQSEDQKQTLPEITLDAHGCLCIKIKHVISHIDSKPLMPELDSDNYFSKTFVFHYGIENKYYMAKFNTKDDLNSLLKYCGIDSKINIETLYNELYEKNGISQKHEVSRVGNVM